MKWPSPETALAAAAGAVTVALTAAAFWLSYEHLHDLAHDNGLGHSPARAWVWPATVDLFIVAGELLMLRAALRRRMDWWAVALTASGSLGSIALNVAAVGTERPFLEYVTAAVPPVAALLAFGALMRQVHERLVDRPSAAQAQAAAEAAPVPPVPAARPAVRPEVVPSGVDLLPLVARSVPEPKQETPKPKRPAAPRKPAPEPGGIDPLVDRARRDFPTYVHDGKPIPFERLKKQYGIGQNRAERIRGELAPLTNLTREKAPA